MGDYHGGPARRAKILRDLAQDFIRDAQNMPQLDERATSNPLYFGRVTSSGISAKSPSRSNRSFRRRELVAATTQSLA